MFSSARHAVFKVLVFVFYFFANQYVPYTGTVKWYPVVVPAVIYRVQIREKAKLDELKEKGETLESFAAKDAEKNSVFDKESEDWKWSLEEEMNEKQIKKEASKDCDV